MSVAFKAAGANSIVTTSTVVTQAIAVPASTVTGDLLMLFHDSDANDLATAPSGWTVLHQGNNLGNSASGSLQSVHSSVFWKVSTGSEGATQSVGVSTATYPAGDGFNQGIMLSFTGAHASIPFGAVGAGEVEVTADTSLTNPNGVAKTHPTVTPEVVGSALVLYRPYVNNHPNTTSTASMTSNILTASPAGVERTDNWDGSRELGHAVYTLDGPFVGAQSYTTTLTTTATGPNFRGGMLYSILIRPANIHSAGILMT